ncbi:MAG: hypothetical protein LBP32_01455 [Spirochaetaceae bacterium]|nr:hypothetical protein [Spirochaetaceae bacterium]
MRKKTKHIPNPGLFLTIILPIILGAPLFGAEITVPRLELATHGRVEEGEFVLSSIASADVALNGGYKYGILLGLSFESDNLEKAFAYRNFKAAPLSGQPAQDDYNALVDRINNQAVLSFRIARATARDLFNLPVEFSYFVGLSDFFCSGDDFPARFGTAPIGSSFRGFYYFPEGIGGNISRQYNGIHGVRGTGFAVTLTPWDFIVPMLYVYQDFSFADGTLFSDKSHYSGDLRLLFNREKIKFEVFTGISAAKDTNNILRGGALAFFSSGIGADFLLQFGIPGWKTGDRFSLDNIYFLMEPRIDFGPVAFNVTFFFHPLRYLQIETPEEQGKADINIKVQLGDTVETRIEGGIETTMGLKVDTSEDFSLYISPFAGFITDGLRWDTKLRINPLVFDRPHEIFELFVGIRTAY